MRLRVPALCPAFIALVLPIVQATAETGFPRNDDAHQMHFARMRGDPGSAAGAYLCARFAMSVGDVTIAADQFLVALQADPQNPLLGRQTLVANILAGRPMTQLIAHQVARTNPSDPIAQLVLAGDEAQLGHWAAAAQHYAAMAPEGPFGLMQKPLLAWAQFGAGRKDAMRILLRPDGGRIDAVGGAFLLQAGLMADLDNRPEDAERFYISAQADLGAAEFTLARALASLQARQGQQDAALKTLAAARAPGLHLEASARRLQSAIAERPVNTAASGIAGIYLAFALLAREQGAHDLGDMLFRLALSLRPDFTFARLQAALALASDGRAQAALLTLAPIPAADPFSPSAEVLRTKFQALINKK
jgi:hypothetical protein